MEVEIMRAMYLKFSSEGYYFSKTAIMARIAGKACTKNIFLVAEIAP